LCADVLMKKNNNAMAKLKYTSCSPWWAAAYHNLAASARERRWRRRRYEEKRNRAETNGPRDSSPMCRFFLGSTIFVFCLIRKTIGERLCFFKYLLYVFESCQILRFAH
jgi:hypothetical protein